MSVKVRDEAHFICLHPGRNEGCENTTEPLLPPTHGSQGRLSWMKPTVSDLCGSVNEAERRPEFGAMRKEKEAAGRKRQRKECVGVSAPGSRSPLRFILSRHRRCRKRSFPSRTVSIIEITSGREGKQRGTGQSGVTLWFSVFWWEEHQPSFGSRLIAAVVQSGEKRSPKSCLIPV